MYDGSIRINTKLNGAGFDSGIKSLVGGLGKLATVLAATFSVAILVNFSKKILTTSADFERLQLAAQIVGGMFGYTSDQVKQFTDDLVASGIQTDIANKAFINFAREGLDTNLLPSLARGAQDLAVFAESGESSSDMFDRLLTGVLTLNTEILRNSGVAVDLEGAYTKWAAAAGTTVNQMGLLEKRQAALVAVTEKLTGVNGLYEMGQKTAAGQMQSNIRIMTELWAAMGAPFQDALYVVVKGFNDLVKAFTAAIAPGGQLYDVMQSLAKITIWVAYGLVEVFNATAKFFGLSATSAVQTESGLVGAAAAAGELAANTEAAGKAASGALASFDKLNVLAKPADEAGSAVPVPVVDHGEQPYPPGEISTPAGADKLLAFIDGVTTFFQLMKSEGWEAAFRSLLKVPADEQNAWVRLGWLIDKVTKFFTDVKGLGWEPAFNNLFGLPPNALSDFAAMIVLITLVGSLIALIVLSGAAPFVALILIIGILVALIYTHWTEINAWLTQAGIDFAAFIKGIWDGIVDYVEYAWLMMRMMIMLKIAEILGDIDTMKAWFKQAWEDIKGFFSGAWDGIVAIWGTVSGWFNTNVVTPIKDWFSQAWEDIKGFFSDAWTTISATWATVSEWFNTNVVTPIKDWFSQAWLDIEGFFTTAWTNIQNTWNTVSSWFDTNVTTPVSTFFSTAWDAISAKVTGVWDAVKLSWGDAVNWFQNTIITPISTAFETAWSAISGFVTGAFTGIGNTIKTAFNGVINFLNGLLNGITSGINSVIDLINSIRFDIPQWAQTLFGIPSSVGFYIPPVYAPQIPYLATGAVIPANAPFAAVLGDHKSQTEILAPEDMIRQIIREEMGGQRQGNQAITIKFAGSMGYFVQQLKPYIDIENRRVGSSMLAGSGVR